VAKGDTLGAIAKRHAVAVTKLAAYNSLADGNRLTPGQVLMIPPQ
jgi:LysM repeat protein